MSGTHELSRNLSATEKTKELPRPLREYKVVRRATTRQESTRQKIPDPVIIIIEDSPKTRLRKKHSAKRISNSLISSYRLKKTEKEIEKQGSGFVSKISKSIRSFFSGGKKGKRKTRKYKK